MGKRSTRTKNIQKVKQALGNLDLAAAQYDDAVTVYLDQFPLMIDGTRQIMELISLTKELMKSSFEGI